MVKNAPCRMRSPMPKSLAAAEVASGEVAAVGPWPPIEEGVDVAVVGSTASVEVA